MENNNFSQSELGGLQVVNEKMEKILSLGVSTNGNAEIEMARRAPHAHIIATTIDQNGLEHTKEILQNHHLEKQIELKLEDVRQKGVYATNSFDYIYARLVLHYITDKELDEVLEELYQILKVGGILYVVVRSTECEEPQKGFVSYDEDTGFTKHITSSGKMEVRRFHTVDTISQVLKKNSFSIVSVQQYDEQLYSDYERTKLVTQRNNVIEVVVQK